MTNKVSKSEWERLMNQIGMSVHNASDRVEGSLEFALDQRGITELVVVVTTEGKGYFYIYGDRNSATANAHQIYSRKFKRSDDRQYEYMFEPSKQAISSIVSVVMEGQSRLATDKKATSSYASWALLSEGVSSARVEAYRLRHLVNRAMSIIEKSVAKDHLYQVAGDIIVGMPERLDRIEQTLDRTSYALSKMGDAHLRQRLPIHDREMVDESIERADMLNPSFSKMSSNVAQRFLDSDK